METYNLASAIKLGVDLTKVEENVCRLRGWNSGQREIVLERADEQIPKEKSFQAIILVRDLCDTKRFCLNAKIPYNNIQEEDSRLIKTAVAFTLLESKN